MASVGIKQVFWTNDAGAWQGAKVRDLEDAMDKLGQADALKAAQHSAASLSQSIDFDGRWPITTTSFGNCTKPNLEDAWARLFVKAEYPSETFGSDDETNAKRASLLSECILDRKCWETTDGSKWTIKNA
jgi:hypothetical protein